jgi:DNA-binding NarL/FixJ family response regulator
VSPGIRVLLVEDNEVYRSSLELLLALQPGIEVVGSAETATEALALAEVVSPDVVLLDFRLPDRDGAEAAAAFRERHPETTVVCLTAEATFEEREAVLAAGAVALIEKGAPVGELAQAVITAAEAR